MVAKQALYHLSHISSPFCYGYFGYRVLWIVYLGWPRIWIFLSQPHTGMNHWHPAILHLKHPKMQILCHIRAKIGMQWFSCHILEFEWLSSPSHVPPYHPTHWEERPFLPSVKLGPHIAFGCPVCFPLLVARVLGAVRFPSDLRNSSDSSVFPSPPVLFSLTLSCLQMALDNLIYSLAADRDV
jgi:hypothetical protein